MPDLNEEDNMSADSVLPNEKEDSAYKSFKNLQWDMHRRSDRIKAKEKNEPKRNPCLTSVIHILVNPTVFICSVQSNETCALREEKKELDFK